MKRLICLLFFNYLFFPFAISCSCSGSIDFFKNTYVRDYGQNCIATLDSLSYSYEYQGLTGQTGHFTLIDTITNIKATIGQPIVVVGQDGLNCGELVHNLQIGTTYLLSLSDGFYEPFEKDTFYLSGCGTHYLNLDKAPYQNWTISSLKELINQITTNIENTFVEQPILIFPNPVTQKLFIDSSKNLIRSLKIYNQIGQLVFNLNGLKSKIEEVIVTEFPKGVYFLLVTTSKGTVRRTFIKN